MAVSTISIAADELFVSETLVAGTGLIQGSERIVVAALLGCIELGIKSEPIPGVPSAAFELDILDELIGGIELVLEELVINLVE